MKPEKIKNIGIFAHVDAGKTTLTEQMLFICGKIRAPGSVDKGTTQTDSMSIERERGISVKAAATAILWKGYNINIIDTPGHIDFVGEVDRSLLALDGAVLVVSGADGIQSHTERLWKVFDELKIPCIVFINKLDRAGSNSDGLVELLNKKFKNSVIKLSKTDGEETKEFVTSADILSEKTIEVLADIYDDIAEKYLNGEPISETLFDSRFSEAVCSRRIIPAVCGSAIYGKGTEQILDAIVKYLPSADVKVQKDLSAVIFKIEHDKSMGKIAHIRMFGGTIKNRDIIKINQNDDRLTKVSSDGVEFGGEKVSQIRKFNGAKYYDVGEVEAGDIAALCGISSAKTGNVIGNCSISDTYRLAHPFLSVKVAPKNPSKLTALVVALKELTDEDPLIDYKWEQSEREININITGKIQLEVLEALLRERYALEVDFSAPTVIYKETPSRSGDGFEAYTMPKPCWAVVHLGIEPLPRGSGVIYDEGNVPHDQLFRKYQTHIKTSFYSSLEQGIHGWEVTDLKVTLKGGEHHLMHTHPLDFFVATPMAFMNGLKSTGTTLLEPLFEVRISAGEEYLGKIISDLTMMRGEFESPIIKLGEFTIKALLPVSESIEYPMKLAAITGGKGIFVSNFFGYRECPIEFGADKKRRGADPLDKPKWILYARGAMQSSLKN